MKIFFDTEMSGLHKDTTLISIGLVSEDNRQFYAELTDYNKGQCNSWIKENVIKNLYESDREKREHVYISNYVVGGKYEVAKMLENWLSQFEYVELISDVSHYDMVLFADLFGGAMKIPENVCPACYDINQDIMKKYSCSMQEAFDMGREDILYQNYKDKEIQVKKHNALYDAKVIKEIYYILNQEEKTKS